MLLCELLNINASGRTELISNLARGHFPPCLVHCKQEFEADSIFWFTLDKNDQVVVMDVTNWYVLPQVKYSDFTCVRFKIRSRVTRVTKAMQDLSDTIDDIATKLTSAQLVGLYEKMQKLNEAATSSM